MWYGRRALVKVQAADVQSGGSMTGMVLLSALKKEDQETGFRQTTAWRGRPSWQNTRNVGLFPDGRGLPLLREQRVLPAAAAPQRKDSAWRYGAVVREQEKRPLRGRGLW